MSKRPPLSGNAAIKNMRRKRDAGHDKRNVGWCAKIVREAFGFTYGVGATAADQWRRAKGHRRRVTAKTPGLRGYPGYFVDPNDANDPGHAVVCLGGGKCIGVDYPVKGKVGVGRIEDVARWCGKPFVGITTQMGGKNLPGYRKP